MAQQNNNNNNIEITSLEEVGPTLVRVLFGMYDNVNAASMSHSNYGEQLEAAGKYAEKLVAEIILCQKNNYSDKEICLWLNSVFPSLLSYQDTITHAYKYKLNYIGSVNNLFESHKTYFAFQDKYFKPLLEKNLLEKEISGSLENSKSVLKI